MEGGRPTLPPVAFLPPEARPLDHRNLRWFTRDESFPFEVISMALFADVGMPQGEVERPPSPLLDVFNTRPTLKAGASGQAVAELQTALNSIGANLQVDGKFGPATIAAVKAFQAARSLGADGVVGTRTWANLSIAYSTQETMDLSSRPATQVATSTPIEMPVLDLTKYASKLPNLKTIPLPILGATALAGLALFLLAKE